MKLYPILFEEVYKSQRLIDSEKGNQIFLRIGRNINAASKFGLGDEWQKETGKMFESGVSAYFLRSAGDGGYMISKPLESRADYSLGDYFRNMFLNVLFEPIMLGQIYVVKGKLIEVYSKEAEEYFADQRPEEKYEAYYDYLTGTDGEPLLEPGSVSVIEHVDTVRFFEKFQINDGYYVRDLFMNNQRDWVDKDIPDDASDELVDYLNIELKKSNKRS